MIRIEQLRFRYRGGDDVLPAPADGCATCASVAGGASVKGTNPLNEHARNQLSS